MYQKGKCIIFQSSMIRKPSELSWRGKRNACFYHRWKLQIDQKDKFILERILSGDYGVTFYLFTHIRKCLGSLRVLSLKHLSMSQSVDKGLWYSFCLTDRNPQNFSQDQNDLKKFISVNRIDAWNWKILGEHKITDVLNPQG